MAVVIAPLLWYSDDLSGNHTKQWNYIHCWCLLLAGLPRKLNHQLQNIHLIYASNNCKAVEMIHPMIEDLLALENGIEMFHAKTQQNVFVVAPVLAFLCDNSRASDSWL